MYHYPQPYFHNIPIYGDLKLYEVLVKAECPMIFTCINNTGTLFFCICCDLLKEQRWIIAPISCDILTELIQNKLTIYDFYKNAVHIYKITWEHGQCFEKVREISFMECEEDLPPHDMYIDL